MTNCGPFATTDGATDRGFTVHLNSSLAWVKSTYINYQMGISAMICANGWKKNRPIKSDKALDSQAAKNG